MRKKRIALLTLLAGIALMSSCTRYLCTSHFDRVPHVETVKTANPPGNNQ
jgi:hypothetical protein